MKCTKCGSRDIDFQEALGQSICVNCGTVLEENTIVSSIEFQESGERSQVVGQYVSASCSQPITGSRAQQMGRHGDSRSSRDATLLNARRAISQLATSLRLPSLYIDRAYRLYQLALSRNFIFGRRQAHVVSTCLYMICRQERSPHLLIDFSDALQINVFALGKSFLQFSKVLNLALPVIDPSLYIHRYASRLEFGEKMATVVTTSLRIITRLKKDWIVTGRRPDGVCACALFIASRAHGFVVTKALIAQLFRISSETLGHRLMDFKATPSAQLTLEQFHTKDCDVEFDPPCFIRNKVNELAIAEEEKAQAAEAEGAAKDPSQKTIGLDLPINSTASQGADPDLVNDGSDLVNDDIYDRADEGEDDDNDLEEVEEVGWKKSKNKDTFRYMQSRIGNVSVKVPIPGSKTGRTLSNKKLFKARAQVELYDNIYAELYKAQAVEAVAAITSVKGEDQAEGNEKEDKEESSSSVERKEQKEGGDVDDTQPSSKQRDEKQSNDEALLEEARSVGREAARRLSGQQSSAASKRKVDRLNEKRFVWNVAVSSKVGAPLPAVSPNKKVQFADEEVNRKSTEGVASEGERDNIEKGVGDGEGGAEGEGGQDPGVATEGAMEEVVEIPDNEWDKYILTGEEKEKRTLIWESSFRVYMDERAQRKKDRDDYNRMCGRGENGEEGGKLRKKYTRKNAEDITSASDAVLGATKNSAASSNINYDALNKLNMFSEDGSFVLPGSKVTGAPTAPTSSSGGRSGSSNTGGVSGSSSSSSSSSAVKIATKGAVPVGMAKGESTKEVQVPSATTAPAPVAKIVVGGATAQAPQRSVEEVGEDDGYEDEYEDGGGYGEDYYDDYGDEYA